MAPDGTLYASDLTPATAAGAGGVVRSIAPTTTLAGGAVVATFETVTAAGDFLTVGDVLTVLTMAEGSNVLFANQTAAIIGIRTYSDTLSDVSPAPNAPVGGAIVDAALNPVIWSWEAVTGALTYNVRWDTRDDFRTATVRGAIAAPATIDIQPPGAAATPPNGRVIYWQVRVVTPVMGPYCDAQIFETQLAAAAVNAPAILGAAGREGSTAAGGWGVSLTPSFNWGPIANATGYEFRLATDQAMTNLIVDATGDNALGAVTAITCPVTLDYNTTYYWQVRGIGATSSTDWSAVVAFTTMEEVVAEAPPEIVIPPAEAPVINIPEIVVPPAEVTVEPTPAPAEPAISETLLWVIIIIGAILVIALIVLVVRTRRTV
jgi:hypothetical protein